ncbi:hypothetical protein SDC9_115323 [bioreactor metagenome]|uniref:FecR protein domain-containing protein n=1 Tax=bioreactor metagenome TaxID=1076179 RepID=A0A645BUU2_9ZZZZ
MDKQLLNYFSDELLSDEKLELFQRIEKDKQLKNEYIRLQNLTAVSLLSSRNSDKEEGLRHFKIFSAQIRQYTQRRLYIRIAKYTAMALIIMASTVWLTLLLSDTATDHSMNRLHVPAGQRAQITLQDGTEVWLNAQSTLLYPSHFSRNNREVEIIGEAYFDVAKDKKRPFIVTTQHVELKVLGTQFNVYSYPGVGYIQTDLIEGSVKVFQKNQEKRAIVLKPNEQVIIRDGSMTVSKVYNPEHLLWKNGIYAFNNERLIDIIGKLQLYYDVQFVVEDPEIFNVRYTGKFRQRESIHDILQILQKIQYFKIERDRNSNVIRLTK